ncbi:MAG: ATP-dependent DNA helicase RecG [Patescibacteria group bacterium]
MDLKTPVREVSKTYTMYAKRLEKLGIKTLEDFLYHVPSRYEDFSITSSIANLQIGEAVTVKGEVLEIKNQRTRNWKTLQKAKVKDETGEIEIIWFNQPFLLNLMKKGDKISVSGKASIYKNKLLLQSPEYEILLNDEDETIHTGRLVPTYPETRGVSSKWLRRQVNKIISDCKHKLLEYLPYSIISANQMLGFFEAIRQIHFPKNSDSAEKARLRLSFDELFLMQLGALKRRKEWSQNLVSNPFKIDLYQEKIDKFYAKLPFVLTNAQKRTLKEIFKDIASAKPMNRLLQGDVGSGKTVVSAIAMYAAFLNGSQSVLLAPTEILAQQHYNTISKLLSPFGIKVGLVTGSTKKRIMNKKSRIKIKEKTSFDILIGTHALLYDKRKIDKLGLVVIDEQQRFGVEQRAIIRKKGKNPHLLSMTATPIPRTIALTMYGDLDLSFLDEMPKGRRKIKTWLVPTEKRKNAYLWIEKQIKDTKIQAFIICPFIEESETLKTVRAATKEYELLKKTVFPNLKLGILHGRLKTKEKETVLKKFKDRKLDILVATPVVEVGIDIPNANIILIEETERFGLAQLHQLRGRVGRSDAQAYCLLFTQSKNPKTIERLKALETLSLGNELAQLDLKLRGHGELYGTMQHGHGLLKIASFSDFELIEKTKKEAEKIFPKLSQYPLLLEKIKNINTKEISQD